MQVTPLVASRILIEEPELEASRRSFGENNIDWIRPRYSCPRESLHKRQREVIPQTQMVQSPEAVAIIPPSKEKATDSTRWESSTKSSISSPLATSQKRITWSDEEDTSVWPSGEKASE